MVSIIAYFKLRYTRYLIGYDYEMALARPGAAALQGFAGNLHSLEENKVVE